MFVCMFEVENMWMRAISRSPLGAVDSGIQHAISDKAVFNMQLVIERSTRLVRSPRHSQRTVNWPS